MIAPNPILSFDAFLGRKVGPPPQPEKPLTLRDFYVATVLPEIGDQAKRSLVEDRTAIRNWEIHTGNPDLRSVSKDHLVRLRDGMLAAGRAAPTVNKTWREIKAILEFAAEEDVIPKVPKIGRRMGSKLVTQHAKAQREIVTAEEVDRLWDCCRFATYPNPNRFPTADLWRAALLMFWMYGPRTLDLFRLRWDSIKPASRLIRFEAMKTRKVQGLPMTQLVAETLDRLRGADPTFVFAGFSRPGAFLTKTGRWQRGYYTSWRTEITPAAGLSLPVLFKHFRESMVTRHNGVEANLGNWIAGHYVPGVSAQNYDLPTERIRRAIEAAEVPACFRCSPAGTSAG